MIEAFRSTAHSRHEAGYIHSSNSAYVSSHSPVIYILGTISQRERIAYIDREIPHIGDKASGHRQGVIFASSTWSGFVVLDLRVLVVRHGRNFEISQSLTEILDRGAEGPTQATYSNHALNKSNLVCM